MTSRPHLAPALLAVAASAPLHRAAAQNPAQKQAESVTVEVYADVATIAPGQTFHLAMQYDIIPDWHIYWVNPGDSGVATTLEVKAPQGFVIGPVQYPGPHRFESAGDLVSYGYAKRATLIVEVTAPVALAPGRMVQFDLHSDWLVCNGACLLGRADTSIVLKTVALVQEVEPANTKRLADAAARMPRELEELKIGRPRWRGSKASPRFEATFPRDVEFDVFPLLVQDVEAHEPTIISLDDGSSRLSVTFDVNESRLWPAGPRPLAVLRVKNGDEEMYYDLVPRFE